MKACKKCKYISVNAKECPICKSKELTEHFSGMVIVLNPENSEIAKEMSITNIGRYALRIKK